MDVAPPPPNVIPPPPQCRTPNGLSCVHIVLNGVRMPSYTPKNPSGMILGTFGQNVIEVHLAGRGGVPVLEPLFRGGVPAKWTLEPPPGTSGGGFLGGGSSTGTPPLEPLLGGSWGGLAPAVEDRLGSFFFDSYLIQCHKVCIKFWGPLGAVQAFSKNPFLGGVPRHDLPGDTPQ